MPPALDLKGHRFGMLVASCAVIKDGKRMWLLQCDCGGSAIRLTGHLRAAIKCFSGEKISCGCTHPQTTHGQSNTRLYSIWRDMLNRCQNSGTDAFQYYGARGITVCAEWKIFEPFYEWAVANGYGDGASIERLDVDGNYCPVNCSWIDLSRQQKNKRNTRRVEYQGRTQCLTDWAKEFGLSQPVLLRRVRSGWPIHEALTVPPIIGRNAKP